MTTIFHTIAAFAVLSSRLVLAANDWSIACRGSCGYESGDGIKNAWSSIVIDGAPELISDLTTASGWSIMDCDDTSEDQQEIRIVCTNPDAGCDHLFDGGANDTIIRLPEKCSAGPFARVVRTWTAVNQTVTSDIARELQKRDLPQPETLSLLFDFDFAAIPESRGTVTLTATATTNPLQRTYSEVQSLKRSLTKVSRSAHFPPHLVERDLFADFINANKIIPFDPSQNNTAHKFNAAFDKDWSKTFDVINVQKSLNLVDTHMSCPGSGDIPGFDAALKLDVDADVQVTLSIGFIIAGSIIPPKISKAAFTAALNGGAHAVFDVNADVTGHFTTGLIPLYDSDYSGMNIPGILSVGPRFSINVQANGDLGVVTDAKVTASYTLPNLQLVFPKDQGDSSASADQSNQNNPVQLSVAGPTTVKGTVEAHMIPRLEVGVNLLSGMAKATVYLQLDGYGSFDMSLSANDTATTTVAALAPTQSLAEILSSSSDTSTSTSSSETASDDEPSPTEYPAEPTETFEKAVEFATSSIPADVSVFADPVAATGRLPSAPGSRLYNRDLQARAVDYSGCVDLDLGLAISAGAEGKLFDLWKDSTKWDLFRKEWDVYNKCFGGTTQRRRNARRLADAYPKRGVLDNMLCPSFISGALTTII